MIEFIDPADGRFVLIGVVRGLRSDGQSTTRSLDRLRPEAVGVGLSAAELESLKTHFVGTPVEPIVPLYPLEAKEVAAVARFDEVELPSPAHTVSLLWATSQGAAMEPLEPDDVDYSEMFTNHIGYFELVRRTVRERRLTRTPPKASTAEELVLAWDSAMRGSARSGSSQLARAREQYISGRIRQLRLKHRSMVAVVDRERAAGVAAELELAPSLP